MSKVTRLHLKSKDGYNCQVIPLSPRAAEAVKKHWQNVCGDRPEVSLAEPPPPIDVDSLVTRDEKIAAMCRLVKEMPRGFWGENGPVSCDRDMWRKANKLAEELCV